MAHIIARAANAERTIVVINSDQVVAAEDHAGQTTKIVNRLGVVIHLDMPLQTWFNYASGRAYQHPNEVFPHD